MKQEDATEKLFSYGTLQQESVQLATFGRKFHGVPATLTGYHLSMVKITDPKVLAASGKEYHPILTHSGNQEDQVTGTIFEITPEELKKSDEYEVDDYQRVAATFLGGITAWVYVKAD